MEINVYFNCLPLFGKIQMSKLNESEFMQYLCLNGRTGGSLERILFAGIFYQRFYANLALN